MSSQEFYVYLNNDSIWWHGTCWEFTLSQRRHPNLSRSAIDTIVEEVRGDPSIDFSTYDPDDADELDEPMLVVVSPRDFAEVRSGVVDEHELERFRCGQCTKVIAAPSN